MIRSKLLTLGALLAFSIPSHATVSFLIDGDLLKDQSGNAIPQNSLFLLVSSLNSTNFEAIVNGSSTAVGSLLNTDDRIIARGDLSAFGLDGVLNTSVTALTLDSITGGVNAGWNPGDPLALLWFPTLTLASSTIPDGTTYGLYTSSTGLDGSDPWVTPADQTSNHKLFFYNASGGDLAAGTNPAASGDASFTVGGGGVVPEPSRMMLGLFGILGLAFRRRR